MRQTASYVQRGCPDLLCDIWHASCMEMFMVMYSELYGLRKDALSQALCLSPAETNTLPQKHDDDGGAGDFRFRLYLSYLSCRHSSSVVEIHPAHDISV